MTEASDRMLILLQELAMLKEEERAGKSDLAATRKRRKEIKEEMKQLAAEQKTAAGS